jgi:hypothetical protein
MCKTLRCGSAFSPQRYGGGANFVAIVFLDQNHQSGQHLAGRDVPETGYLVMRGRKGAFIKSGIHAFAMSG